MNYPVTFSLIGNDMSQIVAFGEPKRAPSKELDPTQPFARQPATTPETLRTDMNSKTPIYQLHISLDDIHPPIWRRVLVPASTSLPKLHAIFQRAMGWQGYHLHAFRVGEVRYGVPDPDFPDAGILSEKRVRLSDIAPEVHSRFSYEYDFGDNWQHTVIVEKILPWDDK